MYSVLLIDDERMILEGIASIVDWQAHGTSLIGKAVNGVEGYQFIQKHQPDIVISDITMPGLDGIGLLKKVQAEFPQVKWIFLSGYHEFEYARQAMRYGVKHYLLKPCNAQQIGEALQEVIHELNTSKKDQQLGLQMEWHELSQQLFNGYPITKNLAAKTNRLLESFYQTRACIFLAVVAEDKLSHETCLEMRKGITKENILESFLDDKWVLLLPSHSYISSFWSTDEQQVSAMVIPIDKSSGVEQLPPTDEWLDQLFYHDKGSIVEYTRSVQFREEMPSDMGLDMEQILRLLKKENSEDLMIYMQAFINRAKQYPISPNIMKGYAISFYLLLMNKYPHITTEDRVEAIKQIESCRHGSTLVDFFKALFQRLIAYSPVWQRYSKVVQRMLTAIDDELSNPDLSLQGLAANHLFMHADYLGKTFKAEVGQGFSSYVTNARINKAVDIIERERDIKVFELAEKIGFGNNPQYFSQLFKRIKGSTPSEMIKQEHSN
ncbi:MULTISPECIES: response regulator transcription factor [Gracilibacillus]|uniref:response regulator transcription factor n=1 Tax=Gracilibacillus TaxID=74385 RepID=UPI0008266481|nr:MULTISPECIES: response regulator [Gracilibacillus]